MIVPRVSRVWLHIRSLRTTRVTGLVITSHLLQLSENKKPLSLRAPARLCSDLQKSATAGGGAQPRDSASSRCGGGGAPVDAGVTRERTMRWRRPPHTEARRGVASVPPHRASAFASSPGPSGSGASPRGVRTVRRPCARPLSFLVRKLLEMHRAGARQGVERKGGRSVMSAEGRPFCREAMSRRVRGARLGVVVPLPCRWTLLGGCHEGLRPHKARGKGEGAEFSGAIRTVCVAPRGTTVVGIRYTCSTHDCRHRPRLLTRLVSDRSQPLLLSTWTGLLAR